MTLEEKQIRLEYGNICFDTPDNTTFKEVQNIFEPFFNSLKVTPENDVIKIILSLNHGVL